MKEFIVVMAIAILGVFLALIIFNMKDEVKSVSDAATSDITDLATGLGALNP
ncbi:MAG: hypothetical protein IJP00_01375 [Firmicutes bacterium]|nr:hypothetical protein [Bacillota bacterium]